MRLSTRKTTVLTEDVTYHIDPEVFMEETCQHIEDVIDTAEGDALIDSFIRTNDKGVTLVNTERVSSQYQLGSFTIDRDRDDDSSTLPELLVGLTEEQIEAAYRHRERDYLLQDITKTLKDREITNYNQQDCENIADDFQSDFDCNLTYNQQIDWAIDHYFKFNDDSED